MVKILSNFDTKLMRRLLDEYEEKYGKENVVFVRRDYIYFVFRAILPMIGWALLVTGMLILMYGVLKGTGSGTTIVRWIGWLFLGMMTLLIFYKVIMSVMDYYLDFTIITPKQITTYNQRGVFGRLTRSLNIAQIKSIRVDQQGIIRSIWNFGSIIFLSEGDRDNLGDINLHYINNPNHLRDIISEVLERNPHFEME